MSHSAFKTVKMEKFQEDIQDRFMTFVCKTDLYDLLDACESIQDKSQQKRLINEIERKFSALEVEYDENEKINNKIKKYREIAESLDIPETADGLEEKIWEEIHNDYLRFPSAEQYMAEMVDTNGDPEFAGDTVRVRILKQFKKYLNVKSDKKDFNGEVYSRKLAEMAYEDIDDALFDNIKYDISIKDEIMLLLNTYSDILFFSGEEREELADLDCNIENAVLTEKCAESIAEAIKNKPTDDETLISIKKIIENNLDRNFESLKGKSGVKENALEEFKQKEPKAKIKTFIKTFTGGGYDLLSEKNKKALSDIISKSADKNDNNDLFAPIENYEDSKELQEIYSFVLDLLQNSSENLESYIYLIEELSTCKKRLKKFSEIFTKNDLFTFEVSEQKDLAEKILSYKNYESVSDKLVLDLLSDLLRAERIKGQGLLRLTFQQIGRNFLSYIQNSDRRPDENLLPVYNEFCSKSSMAGIMYFKKVMTNLTGFKFTDRSKMFFASFFNGMNPEWDDNEMLDYIISMEWQKAGKKIEVIVKNEYNNCLENGLVEENGEVEIENMIDCIITSQHHLSAEVQRELVDLIIECDNKLIYKLIDNVVKAEGELEKQKTYEIAEKFEEIYTETYNERREASVKYRKYCNIKNYYNKIITEKKKTFRNNSFNRWLIWSDNLAKGKFGKSKAIKKPLYYFAFAFNMKYFNSTDEAGYDKNRDIRKKLFEDYYCDNLISYLSIESAKNVEAEPTGYSINLKNFAEVIYLYYLNKEGMTQAEKLSHAEALIEKIKKSESGEGRNYDAESLTGDYRQKLDGVFKCNESELEKYILENYYCDDKFKNSRLSALAILDEQRTAFLKYKNLTDEINNTYGTYCKDHGGNIRFCENFDLLEIPEPYQSDAKFCKLINRIKEKISIDEVLAVKDSSEITRTKMIAAYYYLYCYKSLDSLDNINTGLDSIYRDFKNGLRDILKESGYQQISPKNIYDSVIIIFAYCKVNNIL